jgi:hypothetical protein
LQILLASAAQVPIEMAPEHFGEKVQRQGIDAGIHVSQTVAD